MIAHYFSAAIAKFRSAPFTTVALVVTISHAVACLLSTPAAAQAASSPDSQADTAASEAIIPDGDPVDRIVVTGQRTASARQEIFEQARDLSRIDGPHLYERALPRFETRICPAVIGLRPEFAEAILDRIRANADRLDVPLDRADCSPNLIVGFVDDGRTVLADFEREQPERFSLIAAAEREELLSDDGPVRVWNNIEPLWADGAPLPRYRGRVEMPGRWGHLNRMFLATRTDIHSALVLFDRDAVVGMTLIQLADYATMRGLSHTRPANGDERMSTILGLFGAGGRDIAELTDFDVSYLRSLYFWRAEVPAVGKLRRVGRWAIEAEGDAQDPCPPADGTSREQGLISHTSACGAEGEG